MIYDCFLQLHSCMHDEYAAIRLYFLWCTWCIIHGDRTGKLVGVSAAQLVTVVAKHTVRWVRQPSLLTRTVCSLPFWFPELKVVLFKLQSSFVFFVVGWFRIKTLVSFFCNRNETIVVEGKICSTHSKPGLAYYYLVAMKVAYKYIWQILTLCIGRNTDFGFKCSVVLCTVMIFMSVYLTRHC
jgi:hypothetical protein